MRIWAFPSLYPNEQYGEKWNGIFAHRQYKGLIENGAELKVILPVKWKPVFPISQLSAKWNNINTYKKSYMYDGIEVLHPRVPNLLPYFLDKRSHKEKFCDAVAQMFQKLNITLHPSTDIFFSQWLPESVNVQYAAHKLGLRSAILSIGDDVVIWPKINNETLKAFDELLTNADMRFVCADYLGRETNKIIKKELSYDVIHWGADYDLFKPATKEEKIKIREKYNLPQDKILILNVGTAIIRKGWLDLFDAVSNIKKEVNNFQIVGVYSGDAELNLKEEASKRNIHDVLISLDEVPPENLSEIYKAADIFCLPSHWEGLANVNIEAMSSGLPVITTDVCGHPELITNGVNGILVPPKQPDILSEALILLIRDANKRKDLGNNARKFIVNEWGNFADNSALLYKKLSEV